MAALLSNQTRYSASHPFTSTVRLLVTAPLAVPPLAVPLGPTRKTSMSRKTVSTTARPGLCPKDKVLMVASIVIRSPTWTYPPTPTCSLVGTVTAIQPFGIGRYATSLVLSRSPEGAMRLAVTGIPAGMSTLEPLPATSLTAANAWGGGWLMLLMVRSEAWITVRALMSWLATTTFVPVELPWISGRLAIPAAVANASTASTAPMTM